MSTIDFNLETSEQPTQDTIRVCAGYSLTYRRLLELEVRLLEKEWCGEGGLFGHLTIR